MVENIHPTAVIARTCLLPRTLRYELGSLLVYWVPLAPCGRLPCKPCMVCASTMKKGSNVAKLAPLALPAASAAPLPSNSSRRHTMPSPLPSPSMSNLKRNLLPVTAGNAISAVNGGALGAENRAPATPRRHSAANVDAQRHLALSPLPDRTRVVHKQRMQVSCRSSRVHAWRLRWHSAAGACRRCRSIQQRGSGASVGSFARACIQACACEATGTRWCATRHGAVCCVLFATAPASVVANTTPTTSRPFASHGGSWQCCGIRC